jgi:hypothetical protein
MSKNSRKAMTRKTRVASLLALVFLSIFLFCGVCAAQESCGTEAKLLLSPEELAATVAELEGRKEASGEVYFFDTDKRELLAQGVIIRLRRRSWSDLTVKLRPTTDKKFTDPSSGTDAYKCEVEAVGDQSVTAYSVTTKFPGTKIPETGSDVYAAFSDSQKRLLKAASVTVAWDQVKRAVDIKETDWRVRSNLRTKKLSLELWEWPGGKILELSSKAGSEEGFAAYAELQQVAASKKVKVSADQRFKTSIALGTP